MAPDAKALTIEGAALTGAILPVRIRRPSKKNLVLLANPLEADRLLAPRGNSNESERKFAFVAGTPPENAVLRLDTVSTDSIAPDIVAAASHLCQLVDPPFGLAKVLDALRAGAIAKGHAEPLLALLPTDELAALAAHLLAHPRDLKLLQAVMPGDRWLDERLTALTDWLNNRDQCQRRDRKINTDHFDDLSGHRDALPVKPTVGMALTTLGRRTTSPRHFACLLASARNEGPYLLEWIAHHRSIGFDHIFLYSNDNTDGSDELLRLLAQAGYVTWINQEIGPNILPQFRAYAHALSVLPEILDYRWTALLDIDEFFCFDVDKFASARDFLLWQERAGAEAIASPWLIFASKPSDNWYDEPCIERFPLREKTVNHHVKSMFRSNLFWNANCHHPNAILRQDFIFLSETGERHIGKSPENTPALARNPQAINAFVAHYIFRSAPEALAKIARGRGDGVRTAGQPIFENMVRPFVTLSKKSELIEDIRPRTCAHGLHNELISLRAITGVAECEAKIKSRFSSQLTVWCEDLLRRGPTPGEIEECAVFRSYLQRAVGEISRSPIPLFG
jgi:hypothetical protein